MLNDYDNWKCSQHEYSDEHEEQWYIEEGRKCDVSGNALFHGDFYMIEYFRVKDKKLMEVQYISEYVFEESMIEKNDEDYYVLTFVKKGSPKFYEILNK